MAQAVESGRSSNPIYSSPHRLKLGTFATNASGGGAISSIEGAFEPTWPNVMELASMVDDAGLEAIVPVARWRGFGGETDFNARCLEPFTWAAGVGAQTEHASVFTTCHMPTIHPIVAAKQGSTIDHITNGRFTLNLVCGWFAPEMEMFGAPVMEHELRYDYAEEWIEVVKLLWAGEDDFDFDGRFFKISRGFHMPKPIQQPFPPLMQAGGSPRGRDYAAKHADVAFAALKPDLDGGAEEVAALKDLAREKYGREIQVWNITSGVVRDSDAEAEAYLKYYVEEKGDWVAATNLTEQLGINSATYPPEVVKALKYYFIAGWAGYPAIGTPETIAQKMSALTEIGIDGTLVLFPNYAPEMRRFIDEVLPLLEGAGLRAASAPVG